MGFAKNGEKTGRRNCKETGSNQSGQNHSSIKRHTGENYSVEIDGKKYTPQDSFRYDLLGKLKADAEAYLGEKVTEAVITVPAYFSDAQKQATAMPAKSQVLK